MHFVLTMRADANVNREAMFEQSCPQDPLDVPKSSLVNYALSFPFSRQTSSRLVKPRVWGIDAVIAELVLAWGRDERGESLKEVGPLKEDPFSAALPHTLEAIVEATVL